MRENGEDKKRKRKEKRKKNGNESKSESESKCNELNLIYSRLFFFFFKGQRNAGGNDITLLSLATP